MDNTGSDDGTDASTDRADDPRQEDAKGGSVDGHHDRKASTGKNNSYLQILYGFQNRASYRHASKNCEIVGGKKLLWSSVCWHPMTEVVFWKTSKA